ncbi:MAG: hypothetical protein R3268_15640, partial [Acidiferrobacterales bacterium]|nr:hypothetical protein [Acidiferrobacterales bacterium]
SGTAIAHLTAELSHSGPHSGTLSAAALRQTVPFPEHCQFYKSSESRTYYNRPFLNPLSTH